MADTTPSSTEQFAEAALDTLSNMDELLGGAPDGTDKVAFGDLYAYAVDPHHVPADNVLHALDRDAGLQADFQRLLENTSRYHLPEVAAASTGALEGREIAGCRIAFRPSRANPDQLYVIIEATADKTFKPAIIFVKFSDGRTRRLELPDSQNGKAQVLLETNSEIARGLLDIATEVYVK